METTSIKEWWSKARRTYNFRLLYVGIIAFLVEILIHTLLIVPHNPREHITVRYIIIAVLWIFFIVIVENVFYFIGPIGETIFKPVNPDKYRKTVFTLGSWLSCIVLLLWSVRVLFFLEFARSFAD